MASKFKAGTYDIPVNATEVTLTGLSLDFTPNAVQVSVRQPSGDADIISGYVAGTPTSDGFSAVLSAPAPSASYKLDWIATSDGGVTPTSSDTLAADYATLLTEVAHFLGYDANALTNAQKSEIDRYIQSGVRQFYYPPYFEGMDPNFEWDFLKQTGSVLTTTGVSDYLLPDGFGHMLGQLVFSDDEARRTVPVIPYGDVLRMLNGNQTATGRPRFAAVMSQNTYGEKGQRTKLYLFPRPDAAYTLNFSCASDTGKIDAESRQFPCGGPMYAELVIESCLAIAEQKANDETGAHTAKFMALLLSLVQKGRKHGAQQFGRVGDPDAFVW